MPLVMRHALYRGEPRQVGEEDPRLTTVLLQVRVQSLIAECISRRSFTASFIVGAGNGLGISIL